VSALTGARQSGPHASAAEHDPMLRKHFLHAFDLAIPRKLSRDGRTQCREQRAFV